MKGLGLPGPYLNAYLGRGEGKEQSVCNRPIFPSHSHCHSHSRTQWLKQRQRNRCFTPQGQESVARVKNAVVSGCWVRLGISVDSQTISRWQHSNRIGNTTITHRGQPTLPQGSSSSCPPTHQNTMVVPDHCHSLISALWHVDVL